MPTGSYGSRGLPGLVGANAQVDDEVIRPAAGESKPILAADEVADGGIDFRGELLDLDVLVPAHMDALLEPGRLVLRVVAKALETPPRPLRRNLGRECGLDLDVTLGDEMLDVVVGELP